MMDAGLEKHKGSWGIPEIHAIQTIMPDYQIRVFSSMTPGSLTYTSPEAAHVIDLYNHDNHFDIITSFPAFFDNSYYCRTCNVPYSNKDRHQCLRVQFVTSHRRVPTFCSKIPYIVQFVIDIFVAQHAWPTTQSILSGGPRTK